MRLLDLLTRLNAAKFHHPELGQLRRSEGGWLGSIELPVHGGAQLYLPGGQERPDARALRLAAECRTRYAELLPAIEMNLFRRYSLRRNATGESAGAAAIRTSTDIWTHAQLVYVAVVASTGDDTIELGYELDFDEGILERVLIQKWAWVNAAGADARETVFRSFFRQNSWGSGESVSGAGSEFANTRVIAARLPALWSELRINKVLDLPCGDFHWMRTVDLSRVDYTGADIVAELVRSNNAAYASERIRFLRLDLVRDRLPRADFIMCRDCLVHLSYHDIFSGLRNICASGAKFLFTTTFPARSVNIDIPAGAWRPLNLQAAPFLLPTPMELLNEEYAGDDGAYLDKSLALWRVADLKERLAGFDL